MSWAFSDLALWTLWHEVQARLRRACVLIAQLDWPSFSWHVRQVLLMSLALSFFIDGAATVLSPADWALA
ncbi:MAG: hypothetical protein MUE61_19245 [Vicinamibacterales bacterium]|nr:hypothetical protein [Vicinamibacterales bacterium]